MQNEFGEELIRRCQSGDRTAFAQLVRANQQVVFNFLYRLLPEKEELEEVAQDVWVKVYQSIGKVKNYAAFKTWLHRIALNAYYDKIRKITPRIEAEMSLDETGMTEDNEYNKLELVDPSLIPEEKILSEEWRIFVEQRIQSLPEQHRLMVIMRDVQNLSYEQIADIMDLSIGTVKSRLARAREKLLSELSDYFKDKAVKSNVSR